MLIFLYFDNKFKLKKKKQHEVKILIKIHNPILQKITIHCKLV